MMRLFQSLASNSGVLPDVPSLPYPEAIGKGLDFKANTVKELIQLHAAQQK